MRFWGESDHSTDEGTAPPMTSPTDAERAGPTPDEAGFRQWMAVRSPTLRRKAYLLAGDWHTADDLVQDTLIALYASWPRIARGSNVDAYANRVLVHKFIDARRRPWRRERSTDVVPDRADVAAGRAFDEIDGRDALLTAALAALPAGQRAVVVLRYTDDLTVDEIAVVMDLASGTVKSRLSRGSAAIRTYLAQHGHPLTLSTTAHETTTPEDLP
jgi:RNA polymerase sigma-70 factor (sigma-E family)